MPLKIETCSKTDLATLYGVSLPTFEKWIEPIAEQIRWVKGERQKFPPKLVRIIIDYLGDPTDE